MAIDLFTIEGIFCGISKKDMDHVIKVLEKDGVASENSENFEPGWSVSIYIYRFPRPLSDEEIQQFKANNNPDCINVMEIA